MNTGEMFKCAKNYFKKRKIYLKSQKIDQFLNFNRAIQKT